MWDSSLSGEEAKAGAMDEESCVEEENQCKTD